ncbi:MAG: hypothetical protein CBC35_00365 [Planctomycetes bacterium TMED75]|nr:hypothetical protein [Planctomycetaceae bacterium]OUU96904.1 MAG: hypothetical protein CBC35_00365 [Planctomycetes bacterium TMED75]
MRLCRAVQGSSIECPLLSRDGLSFLASRLHRLYHSSLKHGETPEAMSALIAGGPQAVLGQGELEKRASCVLGEMNT